MRLSPKLSNSEPRLAPSEGRPGSSDPDEVVEVVAALEVGVPPDPEEVGVIGGGYPPMGGSPHPLPAPPRLVSFICVTCLRRKDDSSPEVWFRKFTLAAHSTLTSKSSSSTFAQKIILPGNDRRRKIKSRSKFDRIGPTSSFHGSLMATPFSVKAYLVIVIVDAVGVVVVVVVVVVVAVEES